jgi:hypothetical protein
MFKPLCFEIKKPWRKFENLFYSSVRPKLI